jgi:hypothetical protein
MSVSDPGAKIEWGADSEPRKNERVPSSENIKELICWDGNTIFSCKQSFWLLIF